MSRSFLVDALISDTKDTNTEMKSEHLTYNLGNLDRRPKFLPYPYPGSINLLSLGLQQQRAPDLFRPFLEQLNFRYPMLHQLPRQTEFFGPAHENRTFEQIHWHATP
ncbi:unnamed protein product [Danaus chrysippus]|uniref:(African queen) hypothetical protein n=1 Tax=Danaus chrysippus TaxID=151541 RepID=A0A8J2QH30_9NEOP|nr:unnamed protein product [Danaus chrysippus]